MIKIKNFISESPLCTRLKIKLGTKNNLNKEIEGVLKTKSLNLHQFRAYTECIGSTYINMVQNLDNKWTKIEHLLQHFLFVEVRSKDTLTKKNLYWVYLIQRSKIKVYYSPDLNCNYHWILGKKGLKTLYHDYSRLLKYSNHFSNTKDYISSSSNDS